MPQSISLAQAIRAARDDDNFQGLINAIPYAAHLGVKMQKHQDSYLFHLAFRDALIGNPKLPAIHGGVLAGFMENCALLHLIVLHQQQAMPKVVDFALDYLRSARAEDVWAECEVTRQGRRVAHIQVKAWQSDNNKPVAVARAHMVME